MKEHSFMRTIPVREVSSLGVIVVILAGLFLSTRPLPADSFDWQSVNGQTGIRPWNLSLAGRAGIFPPAPALRLSTSSPATIPLSIPMFPSRRFAGSNTWAPRAGVGALSAELFHKSRRGVGGRLPLPTLQPRHRHRPVLAIGQRLAEPRLEDHHELGRSSAASYHSPR